MPLTPPVSDMPDARVFLSYSRNDEPFAVWLRGSLSAERIEVFRDLDDTIGGEVWWERLKALIAASDAVICILTPSFASSKVCADEVRQAVSLEKRIIPILLDSIDWRHLPEPISKLHAVSFQSGTDRATQIEKLIAAVLSNIDWIREHTRIGELAAHWHREGRQKSLLLRGNALLQAESWILLRPSTTNAPSDLHSEYVSASRFQEQLRIEYERQRSNALRSYSEPILKKRLADLRTKAEVEYQKTTGTIMKISAAAQNLKIEISAIENFLASDGKWHPTQAELHRNLGASEDYSEVYQFPCCGTFVTTGDGPPGQYRADGCLGCPE